MSNSLVASNYKLPVNDRYVWVFLLFSNIANLNFSFLKIFNLNKYITDKLEEASLKLLLEVSGLNNFIDDIDKKDGEKLIKLLEKGSKYLSSITDKYQQYPSGYKTQELLEINISICNEIEKIIEKVEDKIYRHSFYNLSISSIADDWNNPENDIWDTY